MMTDTLTETQQAAAETISTIYQELQAQQTSVVWELLKSEENFLAWKHYPTKDALDKKTLCQYYYHAHPSHDPDRLKEHGHFHLFFKAHKTKIKPVYQNEKQNKNIPFLNISMSEHGYPKAFFTTNYWVTCGEWHTAETLCNLIDEWQFTNKKSLSLVGQWLTAMIQLFKPQIIDLLQKRDEVIQAWQKDHPVEIAFDDKKLEVTSIFSLEEAVSSIQSA